MNRFYLLALIPIFTFASEPSAFGAGNLESPNPYGLTAAEKEILENKQKLTDIKRKSSQQLSTITSLNEKMDGLTGIVDGLNQKSHSNFLSLEEIKKSDETTSLKISDLESKIDSNLESIAQFKTALSEISKIIDDINKNYVSKDELNSLINDINSFKSLVSKEFKQKSPAAKISSKNKYDGLSNAEIEKEALDWYNKKYYTNAIDNYEYLIEKNYHPANSNYMIGVMNYKRKKYDNALAYFKKSASLYDKADYMPILMLYSATSMQKLNDIENAKAFFHALIKKYPNSKEAQSAKKALKTF